VTERPNPVTGVVVEFDAEVGLGLIETSGGDRHPFHCIEIADGSRTIERGTAVRFRALPKFGRIEAAEIAPLDDDR
jgi:cold shock CspA family protein